MKSGEGPKRRSAGVPHMKRAVIIAGVAGTIVAAAAAGAGLKSAADLAKRTEYAAAKRAAAADTASLRGEDLREALLLLARLETDAGRAEDLYRRVMVEGPGSEAAQASLELAKIAYAKGEYRGALDLLSADHGGRGGREADEAAYFRGLCARQIDDRARSRAEFARVTRGELGAWSLIALADMEMEEKRFPRAIELFERAAKTEAHPVARFGLGECYERSGLPERALETYRAIARDLPRSLEAAKAAEKVVLLSRARDARGRENVEGGGERGVARGTSGPTAPSADRYTIQFGAFGSRANAAASARKLEGLVPAIRVESVEMEGRIWHRVRAGVYESKADAERDLARARETLGVSGAVVPLK